MTSDILPRNSGHDYVAAPDTYESTHDYTETSTPVNPETHQLHQRVANHLGQLIGEKTRQFNKEYTALTEKLYDPERSLYACLREATHVIGIGASLDRTDRSWDIITYNKESHSIYIDEAHKMGQPDLLREPLKNIPKQFFHNVFRQLNQALSDRENHEVRLVAINDLSALIAALIPEDFNKDTKLKAHKKETQEEWILRRTLGLLQDTQQLAGKRKKPEFENFLKNNREKIEADNLTTLYGAHVALTTPEAPTALKSEASDFAVNEVISTILDFFASDNCSADEMYTQQIEIERLAAMKEEKEALQKIEEEAAQRAIRIRDLHWEILPATETGPRDKQSKTAASDSSTTSITIDVEQELRDWLNLFNGGRGDIWRTKLGDELSMPEDAQTKKRKKRTGKAIFWAAVWEEINNGQTVTHAIAINGHAGHAARRVVRGDNPNAQPWHQALRGSLQDEADRGVRRIHHSKYGEDKVLEYMTRPVEEIGEKGYKLQGKNYS